MAPRARPPALAGRHKVSCDRPADTQERIRSLVGAIPSAAVLLAPTGEIRALNQEAERLYGRRAEEVIGTSYFELVVPPARRRAVLAETARVLAGEPAAYIEHEIVDPTGRRSKVSCTLARMVDEGGGAAGVIAVGREVTRSARKREEPAQPHTVLRAVFNTSPAAVVIIDPDLRVAAFNEVAALWSQAVLGESLAEGRSILEYVQPWFLAAFQGQFRPALRGEAVTVERNVDPRGERDAWFQFSFVPLPRPGGDSRRNLGHPVAIFAIDISERKRAEKALQENEATLRRIFEKMTDIYFRADLDGTIQSISPSLARYGYQPERVIGGDIRQLCSEPGNWDDLVRILKEEGTVSDVEFRGKRSDGAAVPSSVNAHLLHDGDGRPTGIEGMVRDIARRRQAEEEARRHQAELAHTLRLTSLGYMAARLVHEISQPLTTISSYATGCVMRVVPDTPESSRLLETLQEISAEAMRAAEIVRRTRRMARKAAPQRESLELHQLIQDVARRLEADVRQGGVELVLELHAEPAVVEADSVQIEQVVENLLRNAIEAVEACAKSRRRVVVRTVRNDTGEVEVSVRDSGPGISPASQARLFEPFFTTKPDGLGIGLAISSSIIEAHGGRLRCASSPGQGATLSFTLPAGGR